MENGTDDEEEAAHVDSAFATKAISCKTSGHGTDESACRCNRCDEFLFAGIEDLSEIFVEIDENG